MKILVTGGAGFIGSNLVDTLIFEGYEVIVIDKNLKFKNENAKYFQMDIQDDLSKIPPVDVVVHLAAQVNVQRSIRNPINDLNINLVGGLNVLEYCKKNNVKKIIYTNSAAEIGDLKYLPIDEKHPINPKSPYGLSKYTFRKYLEIYSELYKIEYVSLRLANVYGPRQDCSGEGGVVAIFSDKLINNQIPKIYGDGEQTRDFVYVQDVVQAIILAIKKSRNVQYNVGSGIEVSINELYKELASIIETDIEAEYCEERLGDIKKSVFLIDKIKKIGFLPKIKLKEGLAKTVWYFKNG